VEGEIDCLTMHECGFYTCVSVPNGASKGNQKLEYLDNCWQYFEGMDKVILAVDGDEPGMALRDELARRIGIDKCWTVTYPEGCKDANDTLVKHGKQAVIDMVHGAQEWPIPGVMTMKALIPQLDEWYYNGIPQRSEGARPGFDQLPRSLPDRSRR
jgi:twinkle protein